MLSVGCLLIESDIGRLEQFGKKLSARGIHALHGVWKDELLPDMQRSFYDVQKRAQRSCIAADGQMWAAALALAAQLSVDRVVLIRSPKNEEISDRCKRRQLERLRAYARRNLFFCVCDVLVIGTGEESGVPDAILGGLVNARVWHLEQKSYDAAIRFLQCDDFARTEYAGM